MKRSRTAQIAVLGALLVATVAFAGDDMTSLSYISYLERYATIRPAHANDTLDVVANMPVLAGDRLDTARGARVEVQLADGTTLWLDEFTTVDFDAVALSRDDGSPRTALYLADGSAALEIPATAAGDGSLRLDSPAGAIFLNRPGLYRLELRGGEVRVQVHGGFAELPAGVGSDILRSGEEAFVGQQEGGIRRAAISDANDDFWSWVQERRHVPTGKTAEYVGSRDTSRSAILDSYGDWVYVPTFSSWMWQPRVSVGWVPYSYGRWYWTPVGWSWISYEPWGWYPFHYGSWYLDAGFGWVWGFDPIWGPAWVDWFYSPGTIGWCPRGYYDWWYYHNCNGCFGAGGRFPRRWSEASIDFSGRVRLGVIDPRPWTMVPAGQFGSTHIDRVRLDARRFLQEGEPGREGIVRSGHLVTPFTGRNPGDRVVDSFFRGAPQTGSVPDLSSIMRREPTSGVRSAVTVPRLHLTSTAEITRVVRSTPGAVGTTSQGDRTLERRVVRDLPGGLGTGGANDSTVNRTEVRRGRIGGDETSSPPVVRREVVHRDAPPPVSRDGGSSGTSSGKGSSTGNPPTVERRPPPPSDRPRSNFSSVSSDSGRTRFDESVVRSRESWATATTRRDLGTPAMRTERVEPRITSRADVTSRSYEPRVYSRSVEPPRSYEPRAYSRTVESPRSYVRSESGGSSRSFVSSAPSRGAASHAGSAPSAPSRSSGSSAGGRHRP